MKGYRIIDWSDEVSGVCNASDNPLYSVAELKWSLPTVWQKNRSKPIFDTEEPFIYALIRNHGKAVQKDNIQYIGLTSHPKTRFGNHEKAKAIVKQYGETTFSYAPINFIKGKNKIEKIGRALEEIEHLLIWALDVETDLLNEKKLFTLPGMGKNGTNAWHILNTGYRFSGRMPREIVFPWMLIKPGRVAPARNQ